MLPAGCQDALHTSALDVQALDLLGGEIPYQRGGTASGYGHVQPAPRETHRELAPDNRQGDGLARPTVGRGCLVRVNGARLQPEQAPGTTNGRGGVAGLD